MLDEGTPTLRTAYATPAEAGLYHLIAGQDYDPQDEDWDFKPGTLVRLAEEPLHGGGKGWVAKHPNPYAVRIYVESAEKNAPPLRNTYGIPTANDLYEVQATPH